MCILIEILSPTQAKGERSLSDFKFVIFVGPFPNDGVTRMTVKWSRVFFVCGLLSFSHISTHTNTNNQTAKVDIFHLSSSSFTCQSLVSKKRFTRKHAHVLFSPLSVLFF